MTEREHEHQHTRQGMVVEIGADDVVLATPDGEFLTVARSRVEGDPVLGADVKFAAASPAAGTSKNPPQRPGTAGQPWWRRSAVMVLAAACLGALAVWAAQPPQTVTPTAVAVVVVDMNPHLDVEVGPDGTVLGWQGDADPYLPPEDRRKGSEWSEFVLTTVDNWLAEHPHGDPALIMVGLSRTPEWQDGDGPPRGPLANMRPEWVQNQFQALGQARGHGLVVAADEIPFELLEEARGQQVSANRLQVIQRWRLLVQEEPPGQWLRPGGLDVDELAALIDELPEGVSIRDLLPGVGPNDIAEARRQSRGRPDAPGPPGGTGQSIIGSPQD